MTDFWVGVKLKISVAKEMPIGEIPFGGESCLRQVVPPLADRQDCLPQEWQCYCDQA